LTHLTVERDGFTVSTDPSRLNVERIHRYLCQDSYWAAGLPIEVLNRSIANSICFGVYDGDAQVGFARVITDRATFAYLGDVFVLPSHRGRGLSKFLMECVVSHPDLQGLRRFLLVTRDAHGVYVPFGFTPVADASGFMHLHRPDVYRAES
jgi:GNAT superfamily N-acetyltransferase